MLTGVKDIDTIILNKLGDKDLVMVCRVNKLADMVCKDQMFWLNRILTKFPYLSLEVINKYKGNRSWSQYYINDLRKINHENAVNYLIIAGAYADRLDHVLISIEKGADIHTRNDEAIILASEQGYLDIVKRLVEMGANIHAKNEDAIIRASQYGHLDVVRYLVEAGANFHIKDELAIRLAVKNGDIDIVRYLVEAGANIHAKNDDAIRSAEKYGRLEVVKYLKSLP